MRTAVLLSRLFVLPCAGLLASALAVLAFERAVPLRLELDVESEASRMLAITWFPRKPASREQEQALAAGLRQKVSFELPVDVRAVGVLLGDESGSVRIHSMRLVRLRRLLSWSEKDEFTEWRASAGLSRQTAADDALALELSGKEHVVLANPRLAQPLARAVRHQRVLVAILGGLLGALVGLRPAWLAWSHANTNQRRLEIRLALLCGILLVGTLALLPSMLEVFQRPVRMGGYQDPTGDYEFSFLDHSGRRVSGQIGRLGLQLDPFSFYRNFPGQANASLSVDENGFRGGIADLDRPLAFVLGGSTVFGYGLATDAQTVCARLGYYLDRYTFVNAGVSGFASGQELALLVGHLDGWRPTLYLVVDGWNDFLEAEYYPQVSPWMMSFPVLAVNGQYFAMEERLHQHARSTMMGELPAWPFPTARVERTLESRFEDGLELYVTNIERMNTWAAARGAAFLVVLQPEKGSAWTLTDGERRGSTAAAELSERYRQFVARAVERFAALDIPYVNLLGRAEITEELFEDPCHLTAEGCDLVARILAEELCARGD